MGLGKDLMPSAQAGGVAGEEGVMSSPAPGEVLDYGQHLPDTFLFIYQKAI